ncbi:HSF-type DNA-binding-domain-containing protein [Lipomyces japonicus]|uniref:HSF-type DNA-binding-domain-containing protein n=1 Tax=Lipomyces japonicus TaxID=56871 RepID=UPI0034CF3591
MSDPYSRPGSVSSGSSSDFVKKLFKMLEDPSYRDIVRWSDAGDSFVVVETNEFTKSILPRHFKHGNFASFVRQLNKYDFHKVRSTDEGGICPYGENAWEFKHPDFQLHNKTSLDNIKRKAPVPRRLQHHDDNSSEQIGKLENEIEYLKSTQALLTKHIDTLTANYENTLNTMITMQRSNETRDELGRSMLSHMQSLFATQVMNPQSRPFASSPEVDFGQSNLMSTVPEDFQNIGLLPRQEHGLNYLNELAKRVQVVSSSASSQLYMQQQQFFKDDRSKKLIEHIQQPLDLLSQSGSESRAPSEGGLGAGNSEDAGMMEIEVNPSPKSPQIMTTFSQNWAVPPKVLLVEDDATSRRVSNKFLQIFGCESDVAVDGLAAVNKMNMSKYDIVLMDIIMPNLDGVSASSLIRQFDPLTPIIAMTGNVSGNDVLTYYSHGMNDVLAKPFTKENLLDVLEKHLIHLKQMKEI